MLLLDCGQLRYCNQIVRTSDGGLGFDQCVDAKDVALPKGKLLQFTLFQDCFKIADAGNLA